MKFIFLFLVTVLLNSPVYASGANAKYNQASKNLPHKNLNRSISAAGIKPVESGELATSKDKYGFYTVKSYTLHGNICVVSFAYPNNYEAGPSTAVDCFKPE